MVEISTSEKLARALQDVDAPRWLIAKAREGYYDDFKSPLATPIIQLVHDLEAVGLNEMSQWAIDGEFDSTKEESAAWADSPEGRLTYKDFFDSFKKNRKKR